jgi:hypothetical protein
VKVILVERVLDPPMTAAQVDVAAAEPEPCFALRGVRFLHTYLSPGGARSLCVYAAPDAESVREGFRASGITWERIWAADFVVPTAATEE